MSDATSPVELAEKLGAHADDADHTALKYDRIQQRSLYDEFRAKAADLRAAASMLRELGEREKWLPIENYRGDVGLWRFTTQGLLSQDDCLSWFVDGKPRFYRPLPAPPEAK